MVNNWYLKDTTTPAYKAQKEVDRLTAENADLQAQIDALQQKVHLCAGYDRLEEENADLLKRFRHMHVKSCGGVTMDGDNCLQCGLDLRHPIHTRALREQALQDLADNDAELIDWGSTETGD